MKKKNIKSLILIALFTCCFAIVFSGCNIFKDVSNLLNSKEKYDFEENTAYNSFAYSCATAGLSMFVDTKIKDSDQNQSTENSNNTSIEEKQKNQMFDIARNYGLLFENFLNEKRFVFNDVEVKDAKSSFKNNMSINLNFLFNTDCNFKLNYCVTKNLSEKDKTNNRIILSQYGGTILIENGSNTMIIGVAGYVFSKNDIISTEITIDYKTVNKIKVTHVISEENQPYIFEYSKMDSMLMNNFFVLKKISVKENLNDKKEVESLSISTNKDGQFSNFKVKIDTDNKNLLCLEVEKTEEIPAYNYEIFQTVNNGVTKYRIDKDDKILGTTDRFIIPPIA